MNDVFNLTEFGAAAVGSFVLAFLAAKACLGGLFRVMKHER